MALHNNNELFHVCLVIWPFWFYLEYQRSRSETKTIHFSGFMLCEA